MRLLRSILRQIKIRKLNIYFSMWKEFRSALNCPPKPSTLAKSPIKSMPISEVGLASLENVHGNLSDPARYAILIAIIFALKMCANTFNDITLQDVINITNMYTIFLEHEVLSVLFNAYKMGRPLTAPGYPSWETIQAFFTPATNIVAEYRPGYGIASYWLHAYLSSINNTATTIMLRDLVTFTRL